MTFLRQFNTCICDEKNKRVSIYFNVYKKISAQMFMNIYFLTCAHDIPLNVALQLINCLWFIDVN